jgi:Fe-S cluster assembly iron-binding protein IscA
LEAELLTVTAEAAEAIQDLVSDYPGAGLRISATANDGNQVELGLALSEQPVLTDQVIEHDGCRVFVDEAVAPLLDGRTLDARVTPDDEFRFTLLL